MVAWTAFANFTIAADLDGLDQAIAERRAIMKRSGMSGGAHSHDFEARKRSAPVVVDVLDKLSSVLPDNTYLTDLSLEAGQLRISGISADAAGLVPLLEGSGYFKNASFYAPTTRLAGTTDRFSIEALVVPRRGRRNEYGATTLNRQSIVAIGVFFGVLIAACAWGLSFVVANHRMQSEFEAKSQILDDLRHRAVINRANDGRIAEDTRGAAISAPTETLAASDLHRRILATLESGGGAVHSIQAEATTETIGEGLRRVNAQVAFDSSIDSLQQILFHLETAIPFVFVELDCRPVDTDPCPRPKNGDLLRITLSVSSYWKSSEPPNGGGEQKHRS